jgi:hypothetical protein
MKGGPGNGSTSTLRYEGWWEKIGYRRQPMLELTMQVADGRIVGSGTDIVGPFTFSGSLSEAGEVVSTQQHRQTQAGAWGGAGGEPCRQSTPAHACVGVRLA